MIVAFSTSSRQASVALLASEGVVLWSGRDDAPQTASGVCMRLLQEGLRVTGQDLGSAALFLADLGPGSFTGVRVGVTLAKAFAFALGVKAGGADAFDLIDPQAAVVIPSKRGEWFVRIPGQPVMRTNDLPRGPFVGFGPCLADQTYPDAKGFSAVLDRVQPVAAEQLLPAYLIEPSISMPKKPFGASVAR